MNEKQLVSQKIYSSMLVVSVVLWLVGLIMTVLAFARLIYTFTAIKDPFYFTLGAFVLTVIIGVIFKNNPLKNVERMGNGGWTVHFSKSFMYPVFFLLVIMILTATR